jgi:Tfp pilus assembly protein PilO
MRERVRLIVSIAVAVVLLLLILFLLVRPKQGELSDLREEVEAEEQTTVSLRADLGRLQALEENAPELRAELAELDGFVPQRHQIPNFIFLVQEAANRSGVGFVQITPQQPKPPPEGATLAQVNVQITASGGYFAIQDLLRRLYDLDRAVRIDTVALTTTGEGQQRRLDLSMDLRIFFELPEGGVTGAPAPAPTPGETPTEEGEVPEGEEPEGETDTTPSPEG